LQRLGRGFIAAEYRYPVAMLPLHPLTGRRQAGEIDAGNRPSLIGKEAAPSQKVHHLPEGKGSLLRVQPETEAQPRDAPLEYPSLQEGRIVRLCGLAGGSTDGGIGHHHPVSAIGQQLLHRADA